MRGYNNVEKIGRPQSGGEEEIRNNTKNWKERGKKIRVKGREEALEGRGRKVAAGSGQSKGPVAKAFAELGQCCHQVVEMSIAWFGKLGYLTSQVPPPDTKDPNYHRWSSEDAMVKLWLINSMDPHVIIAVIQLPTAKAIWDFVARVYFDRYNPSKIYEPTCRMYFMKQDGKPVDTYYYDLGRGSLGFPIHFVGVLEILIS
ncbi:hypothetical protein D8674_024658 [Pyrus ussuriensis x Pyrus communis]|uniref:Retrotransposon Copia-like N-terminal domain-containing protein n=1 Tax=Pyrus ussuriensis x Pyrus communis TaxID=2448454 RepID=A0A5N5H3I9_9ROSA|nr:hypothetical protein D8674_024658 [Pyrus ussuriensis x Pyrus communis]